MVGLDGPQTTNMALTGGGRTRLPFARDNLVRGARPSVIPLPVVRPKHLKVSQSPSCVLGLLIARNLNPASFLCESIVSGQASTRRWYTTREFSWMVTVVATVLSLDTQSYKQTENQHPRPTDWATNQASDGPCWERWPMSNHGSNV